MNIAVYIVIGTLITVLLVIGVIIIVLLYQRRVFQYQIDLQKMEEEQQKQLLHASIESQEKERKSIASDLHDEIGATLSAVRLLLHQLQQGGPEQNSLIGKNAKILLDDVIQKVRQISHQLQPEMLKEFGLDGAFRQLASKISKAGVDMSYYAAHTVPRLAEDQELSIYRIVIELVNNTLKHAGARRLQLTVASENGGLKVRLENDGKSFSQLDFEHLKHSPNGLGLKNIQSRVNILKATIAFKPVMNDGGTQTTLEIPMTA
jgi:two-component system NarL family sensor kinase